MQDQFTAAAERLLGTSEQSEKIVADVPELESPEVETPEAVLEVEQDIEEVVEDDTTPDSELEEVGDDSTDEPEVAQEDNEDYYTVKVDGEEFEVNLEELQKGYQLEKSYTKKAQGLAEEKKELANLQKAVAQQRDMYLANIEGQARQQRSGIDKAMADLEAIDPDVDPLGYVRKQAEVTQMEKGLQQSAHAFAQAKQEADAQWQIQKGELVKQCHDELATLLPEWTDPAKQENIRQQVSEYAVNSGYSPEELSNITASRDIVVLNKARMYDELVKNKVSVEEKRTAKIRPKLKSPAPKTRSTVKARAVKEQRAKHKSSGTLRSAQESILAAMSPNK